MAHVVQVALDESLLCGRDDLELQRDLAQGLILLDYLSAKVSIGRFAELMGMGYEEAMRWLHRRGVATLRKPTDERLEVAFGANFAGLTEDLGIGSDPGEL
ncbi:MAG: hypothetical protein GY719_06640 [bacterium]|nr:hypothetical protein [bacterium]